MTLLFEASAFLPLGTYGDTPDLGDDSTLFATTEFVKGQGYLTSAPTGATGAIGNTGPTGANIGFTGVTGPTGNSGATGSVGNTGNSGGTGLTGLTGNSGATGAVGSTGLTGNSGATGVIGKTGNTGNSGATGVIGKTGNTGNSGGTGLTGLTGNSGATGAVGSTGLTGATGTTGTAGSYTMGNASLLGNNSGATAAPSGISLATGLAFFGASTIGVTGVWGVTGNSGTNPATQYIGTSDNQPLMFGVNGSIQAKLTTLGQLRLAFVDAAGITGTERFIINDDTGALSDFSFVAAGGGYPTFNLGASNGTPSARTVMGPTAILGNHLWWGYDGTAWIKCAEQVVTATSVASGNIPVKLDFKVNNVLIASMNSIGITLSGVITAPTPVVSTNTTQLATTAFVVGQAATTSPLMDNAASVGTSLLYSRQDHIHPVDISRAPINSPTFTGTPSAPEATLWDSSNLLATTSFVQDNKSYSLEGSFQAGLAGGVIECWYAAGAEPGAPTSTLAVTAGRLYAIPFYASRLITLDRLAFNVSTQSNGQNARIGIYSSHSKSDLYPDTLIYDSGNLSTTGTGVKNGATSLSISLTPGLYWFAMNCSSTPTVRGFVVADCYSIFGYNNTLNGSPNVGLIATLAFGALPVTFPSGAPALSGSIPGIWARLSS